MTDQLRDRIRAHYQQLDSQQTPVDLESIRDSSTAATPPATSRIRRFPAVAMGLSFAGILAVALGIIWLAQGTKPDDVPPASPEEAAVDVVQTWADAVRTGDTDTAFGFFGDGSQAQRWMPPEGRLGWLVAIGSESSLGECEADTDHNVDSLSQLLHNGELIYVSCPWTISDPLSVAVDGETADLEYLVSPEGELIEILGVGVRLAWKDPFLSFAQAKYPTEFEDACLPLVHTDEQYLGHSLTRRCGEFYMSIADEAVAALE